MILTEVMGHFLAATQNLLLISLPQCWSAQGSTSPSHILAQVPPLKSTGNEIMVFRGGCRGNKVGGVSGDRDGPPRRNSSTHRKRLLNL